MKLYIWRFDEPADCGVNPDFIHLHNEAHVFHVSETFLNIYHEILHIHVSHGNNSNKSEFVKYFKVRLG